MSENFYDGCFEDSHEEEDLTEEEVKELEEMKIQFEGVDAQLIHAINTFNKFTDNRTLKFKRIGVTGFTLKDNDLKAWIIATHRFMHTGILTQGEFFGEIIRHGLRSMLISDKAGAINQMMSYLAMMSLPPEARKRASLTAVREGLKAVREMRDKSVAEVFLDTSFDFEITKS